MSLIPFAYSRTLKKLVDATEVPRGLACDCVCPSCNMEMQARQGEINEHHFSHHKNADIECSYSYWVSVRDMVKQIIQETKYFKIKQHLSKNLHSLPYALNSPIIKVFHLGSSSSSFDFTVKSSIGKFDVVIITPVHHQNLHKQDVLFSELVLAIDLVEIERKGFYSNKQKLAELVLNNPKNKRFLAPCFKKNIAIESMDDAEYNWLEEDNWSCSCDTNEQDEVNEAEYETKGKVQYVQSDADTIILKLYLDKRNINAFVYSIIEKMPIFYYASLSRCTPEQLTDVFTIIFDEGNLKFISYKNHFFALATLSMYYVVYEYHLNEFIKISNTINYDNIFTSMEQYIKRYEQDAREAELLF